MLAEDIRHGPIGEILAKTHSARDLRHNPPIGFYFAWGLQEWALPRDTSLGIGDGAIFLSPGARRQEDLRPCIDRVVRDHIVRYDKEIELGQRVANRARPRQGYRRIGPHDPERLDLAALYRVEHMNGFQALTPYYLWCIPEAGDTIDLGRRKRHMRSQLVGKAADLASTHRIRLTGQRERPHTRFADPARREMAVDDAGDLVGSLRCLIYPLRK